jgi:hypothetical protein
MSAKQTTKIAIINSIHRQIADINRYQDVDIVDFTSGILITAKPDARTDELYFVPWERVPKYGLLHIRREFDSIFEVIEIEDAWPIIDDNTELFNDSGSSRRMLALRYENNVAIGLRKNGTAWLRIRDCKTEGMPRSANIPEGGGGRATRTSPSPSNNERWY